MANNSLFLIFGLAAVASIASFVAFCPQNNNSSILSLTNFEGLEYDSVELGKRVSEFAQWSLQNSKQYGATELKARFLAWNKNYDIVREHNAKNLSWTLEMNKFADLNREEFAALHLGFDANQALSEERNEVILNELEAPTSVDWRNSGAVSSIKNQAQCGCCWAFASSTALEGLYKIKRGSLVELSAQQLLDCSGSYGNQGCNGGTMVNTYRYTQANGIERLSSYPYQQAQGSCRHSSSKSLFKNSGYQSVQSYSYTQLQAAVAQGPVTVAVEADQSVFQLYKSGVISSGCGTSLDHAITAVGYTSSYWIVKNQWGSSWGANGYVMISKGSQNGGAGVCGINMQPSYPTL